MFIQCVCVCAGAVFPTGGIGGRLGRHSEGGAKNCAQQKKKEKEKQELCFFLLDRVFFCAPFYISNQYFDIKKNSNIRVKWAKNRKRKGYVRPWCCQNMLAQWGVWLECVCVQETLKNKIMKRQKPSGAQFKKKRKEEEEKRAKEKGKSLNPVLA